MLDYEDSSISVSVALVWCVPVLVCKFIFVDMYDLFILSVLLSVCISPCFKLCICELPRNYCCYT